MEGLTPQKRLDMLKVVLTNFKSNNDTQKLAILCTIPKFISNCEVSENELKVIYDEIGFSFINRLLRSSHIPENCSKYSFKSVSINILKSFSNVDTLAEDKNMLENIPIINKIMTDLMADYDQNNEEITVLMTDILETILNVSKTSKGCECLIYNNTISTLENCIDKFSHGWSKAFDILHIMFQHPSFLNHNLSHQQFSQILINCSKKVFSNPPLPEVFDVLKHLAVILENCEKDLLKVINIDSLWPILIEGLNGMLRSKLNINENQLAVKVSSLVASLLGVDFFLKEKKDEEFFFLAFKLAAGELGLTLDSVDQRDQTKLHVYASCCKFVETVIHHCGMNEQNAEESREDKLRGTLFELMMMIFEEIKKLNTCKVEQEDVTPYLILLLRLVCSYVSFEEFALDEDVVSAMPALIKIYNHLFRESFNEKVKSWTPTRCECKEQNANQKQKQYMFKRFDIPVEDLKIKDSRRDFDHDLHLLDMFLPGLENLSHLREVRQEMLVNDGLEMLLGYFCYLCQKESRTAGGDDDDDEGGMGHEDRLVSINKLCDIFCNFVYDGDDLCDELCFQDVCYFVLHILISPKEYGFIREHEELFLSLQTLCVILLYKTDICREFDPSCLEQFASSVLSSTKNLKSKNSCVKLLKHELKICSERNAIMEELLKS